MNHKHPELENHLWLVLFSFWNFNIWQQEESPVAAVLTPHWAAAEYFILKAEIECPELFTRYTPLSLVWGVKHHISSVGLSIRTTAWNMRRALFFSQTLIWNSVILHRSSWRSVERHFVLQTKRFKGHLRLSPGSDSFSLLYECFRQIKDRNVKIVFCILI